MKELTTKQFIDAPNEIQVLYTSARIGLTVSLSKLEYAQKHFPEYFE